MQLRCLALAALALGCGKQDGDKTRWKEPRTPYIAHHGAKLMLPPHWRAQDDEIFDEGKAPDRSALGDAAFAASDDRYEVMSLQYLPTTEDLCATSKVGAIFEHWAVNVERIDKLPDGCKITAEMARAYFRHVGDHTLRFDCTVREPAQCDQLWRKIVLP